MPLVLKTLKTFFLSKDEKSLSSHTYLYTPMPPDTHTPLRYACGSSGLRAAPPPPGRAANTPPPPSRQPPPPPPPASFDRYLGGMSHQDQLLSPPRGLSSKYYIPATMRS